MKALIFFIISLFVGTTYINGQFLSQKNNNDSNLILNRRLASVITHSQERITCKYITNDIGTIIGKGQDIHKARSVASKMCFEKRMDLFEETKKTFPSTRQGQLIIDSCVNIKCS